MMGYWDILGYDILLCRFFGHSQMPFLFSSSSHFDGLFMNIFSFYSDSLVIFFSYLTISGTSLLLASITAAPFCSLLLQTARRFTYLF